MYFDLISLSLPKDAPQELKDLMNSLGFEYQSEYARRYTDQGKAEGRAQGLAEGRLEGRMELTLALLTKRFGPLSSSIQTRVRRAQEEQLEAVAERTLTAPTLDEALGSLA